MTLVINDENADFLKQYNLVLDNYDHDDLYDYFKVPHDDRDKISGPILERYFSKQFDLIFDTAAIPEKHKRYFLKFTSDAFNKLKDFIKNKEVDDIKLSYLEQYRNMIQPQDSVNKDRFFLNPNPFIPDPREKPVRNMNPIVKESVTHLVNIDTLFRKNYDITSSTDFVYEFQEPLHNVTSMKLSSLEIPNIWYSFSESRRDNEFRITTRNVKDQDDQTYVVRLPQGNYTSEEFEDSVNNLLLNQFPDQGPSFIRVTISNLTGRVSFRANNPADLDANEARPLPYEEGNFYYSPDFEFEIDFVLPDDPYRELYRNFGWGLGFRKRKYQVTKDMTYVDYISDNITEIEYEGYLEGEGTFGGNINNYLLIGIDDFNKNFKHTVTSGSGETFRATNIIGRISVTSGSNTLIINNSSDRIFKQRDYFGPVTIEKIKMQIYDRFGDVIELKNTDYSIALEFTQQLLTT